MVKLADVLCTVLLAQAVACSSASDTQGTGEARDGAEDVRTKPDTKAPGAQRDAGRTEAEPAPLEPASATHDESVDDAGSLVDTQQPVTYQRQIRGLLESNCVECHTRGGVGPSEFDDWSTVKTLGPAIVAAVAGGRMPPWPADDSCHALSDSRALPQASKELFARWKAGGYQEGELAEYVAPTPRRRLELGPPTLTMKATEAFTPATNSDSYRCFFVGTVASDTYVTALDLVPGVRSEVHHIQLHRVEPEGVADIRRSDESASGAGYPCTSLGISTQNMFSYRPGALAVVLNEGDAIYFKAGSGLILQIHYNTQFLPSGQKPEPDQSAVTMWTLKEDEQPKRVIYRTGVMAPLNSDSLLFSNLIPADTPDVVGEAETDMRSLSTAGGRSFLAGEIVGMTPHAHAWATRMTATLKQGSQEKCLVDVPDWDYNWQLDYMFEQGIPYGPDDTLHVECSFDNTAENQPIVNGMRTPVATITFGEKTLDEMCLHYIWLRFPYDDFVAARR